MVGGRCTVVVRLHGASVTLGYKAVLSVTLGGSVTLATVGMHSTAQSVLA